MKLTMVRHTAVDVPPGICYGQSDVGVGVTFPQEAEQVRRSLIGLTFHRVYSSPLKRCTLLAHACGFDCPITDDRLKEMDFGEWEMQRWDEIADPRLQQFYDDYEHVPATGGESFADQRKRVRACLDDIASATLPDGQVLVFAHGGVIAAAMMECMGLTSSEAFALQPRYGQIVAMQWPSERK